VLAPATVHRHHIITGASTSTTTRSLAAWESLSTVEHQIFHLKLDCITLGCDTFEANPGMEGQPVGRSAKHELASLVRLWGCHTASSCPSWVQDPALIPYHDQSINYPPVHHHHQQCELNHAGHGHVDRSGGDGLCLSPKPLRAQGSGVHQLLPSHLAPASSRQLQPLSSYNRLALCCCL
jgi:hypothetical protein